MCMLHRFFKAIDRHLRFYLFGHSVSTYILDLQTKEPCHYTMETGELFLRPSNTAKQAELQGFGLRDEPKPLNPKTLNSKSLNGLKQEALMDPTVRSAKDPKAPPALR